MGYYETKFIQKNCLLVGTFVAVFDRLDTRSRLDLQLRNSTARTKTEPTFNKTL